MSLKYKIVFAITMMLSMFMYTVRSAILMMGTISVTNHINQATVVIDCNIIPVYTIFSLHNPERIVIDFFNTSKIRKHVFPINFNNTNLVKCIRMSRPVNNHSTRIVLDLTDVSDIKTITQKKIKKHYCIILTVLKKKTPIVVSRESSHLMNAIQPKKINSDDVSKTLIDDKKKIINTRYKRNQIHNSTQSAVIVVAIDAGHGGQDPGAIGKRGICEKNITINIAKQLKSLLDKDPIFEAVMIRNGDYFLSVTERSEIARKKGANVLISIHTDASLNINVKGASVWVLSNRRAKSETTHWLRQCKEKYAELLGGLGDILTNYYSDPYFNHLVLDLQFGYAQQVGYDIAVHVLRQLKNINILHKEMPEYSGFGVLRSPDIPSILVETGFISNNKEECLLANNKYQKKIAQALYKGLRTYFITDKIQERRSLNHIASKVAGVYINPKNRIDRCL